MDVDFAPQAIVLKKAVSIIPLVAVENFNKGGYNCNHCQLKFSNAKKLRNHLLEEFEFDNETVGFLDLELGISESDVETECSTPGSYVLEVSKPFSAVASAIPVTKNTVLKIQKEIICPKCSKLCKSQKGLQQHKAKAHTNRKKKETCVQCNKNFKHKYALKFHVNQVHDKSTRAVCEFCGISKYNKYLMTMHLNQVHGCTVSDT